MEKSQIDKKIRSQAYRQIDRFFTACFLYGRHITELNHHLQLNRQADRYQIDRQVDKYQIDRQVDIYSDLEMGFPTFEMEKKPFQMQETNLKTAEIAIQRENRGNNVDIMRKVPFQNNKKLQY